MADQVLIEEAFVCSINIRGRGNIDIPAGRSFIREALVPHTFDKLESQGYLSRYQREQPIQPIGKTSAKKLAAIDNETPDAAMNPPKISDEQKLVNIRKQAQAKAAKKAEKAQKAADKAQEIANAKAAEAEEEVKAQEALEKVEGAGTKSPKKESTVQQIWVCDPEVIKDHSFEQLLL